MLRPSSALASRRGIVVMLCALSLVAVIGSIALVADGGLLLEHRRQVQAAADLAAMAAATDLFTNYQQNKGLDPSGTAAALARQAAAAQGYTDGTAGTTVTVNIPPQTGDHVGQACYAEVTVQYRQPRFFSGLFGTESIPVTARAVSRGQWTSFNDGILVLDLYQSESLKTN